MDSYNVKITRHARALLDKYVTYIEVVKQNPIAADNVFLDALDTADRLSAVAGSLGFCADPDLRKLGYKKIKLLKHDYMFIYHIDSNDAVVDAVYHTSEDYENLFIKSLRLRK